MDNESSLERHKKSVGDIGIGQLCGPDAKRDAIHFACAPVEAGETLYVGQAVVMRDGKAYGETPGVGIVDPFLPARVHAGDRFWLILNPGSITAMRHAWEHPAFGDELPLPPARDVSSSLEWLNNWCNSNDSPRWETLRKIIEGDGEWVNVGDEAGGRLDGEYFSLGGIDGHAEIPYEFWQHAEAVIGKPIRKRPEYFSCSC